MIVLGIVPGRHPDDRSGVTQAYKRMPRSRKALAITDSELRLIAAPAQTGLIVRHINDQR